MEGLMNFLIWNAVLTLAAAGLFLGLPLVSSPPPRRREVLAVARLARMGRRSR